MTQIDRPFGRYLEDFEIGDVYRHWPGKTITEADDHLFCMITMNHHPLHTNEWFAQNETVHGDTIYAATKVLDKKESSSRPDRGIVTVETRAFNQREEEVCYFRRKVMVWKREAAPQRSFPYGDDVWGE